MSDNTLPIPPDTDFRFFVAEDGRTHISVRLEAETVWLSQKAMAELFAKDVRTINEHIQNILEEKELGPVATIRNFRIVQQEGGRQISRDVEHYNLEMILAVGYRVRSSRGTQFRRWATALLKEYVIKGFVMDDERLKAGTTWGKDYFDELLERIRDIRSSEKRAYQKIRDIFTLAADYDPSASETVEFFRIIQNKLHWAITGKTAPQLIAERSDPSKPNMGLTSWAGAKVRKADVAVAKNYLDHGELESLNRIVAMYLDYAEDQAKRNRLVYMKDWRAKLDAFLRFNDRAVLDNPGLISMEVAKALAEERYEEFSRHRLAEETEAEIKEDIKKLESYHE
ncbi:virulence RhuM family protein [bacterium]|nr:virulence RhuM family protein [bacterium]